MKIKAHKGGRSEQAPHARMTSKDKKDLLYILSIRNLSMADWIIEKMKEDLQLISKVAQIKRG
jgi:hypothetical protein